MSKEETSCKRHFESQVPAHLLEGLNAHEKWMYGQQSIQGQQNEAILERLEEGERRFNEDAVQRAALSEQVKKLEERVSAIEKWKIWLMGIATGIGIGGREAYEWAKSYLTGKH